MAYYDTVSKLVLVSNSDGHLLSCKLTVLPYLNLVVRILCLGTVCVCVRACVRARMLILCYNGLSSSNVVIMIKVLGKGRACIPEGLIKA